MNQISNRKLYNSNIHFSGKTENKSKTVSLSGNQDIKADEVCLSHKNKNDSPSQSSHNIGKILAGSIGLLSLAFGSLYLIKSKKKPTAEQIDSVINSKAKVDKIKEVFSLRPEQYRILDTKMISNADTVENTIKNWQKDLSSVPNTMKEGTLERVVNHKPVKLIPHFYSEDDVPETFLTLRTYNEDFSSVKVAKGEMKHLDLLTVYNDIVPPQINKKFMAHDVRSDGVAYIAGVTDDGKKYLTIKMPTGRQDRCGRAGFSTMTMVSPHDKFTQVQKDLISTMSASTKEELKLPYVTTQSVIDFTQKNIYKDSSFDSYLINHDVMLSEINTLAKQHKSVNKDILNRLDTLKAGDYLSNLE